MNVLILMIPMALVFAGLFVYAFFWATSSGQFDDVETPALRMLNEDKNKMKDLDITKKNKKEGGFSGS